MKKLTTEEKKRRGTYEANKIRTLNVDLLTKVPAPTMPLTDAEKAYYRRFCREMINNGTLSPAFIPAISRAAKCYGRYLSAMSDCERNGCYQVTASGYTAKNAYFQVLCDTEKSLLAYEKSMGLDLVTSLRVPEKPETVKDNPFDSF